MKVLIVDDEVPARARLRTLLDGIGEHVIVAEAGNGEEALTACERHQPDIVLLDIRMPGMDGLEAAARLSLGHQPPAVVFVTAYGDHALTAFETEAVDYLLKPVRRERLVEALKRARRLNRAQLEALNLQRQDVAEADHILVRRRGRMELIPFSDIRYFQADQKYVTVNHVNGEDLIEDSLKLLERQFADGLVRVHRNALVSTRYLAGFEREGDRSYVLMRGCDDRLEVSRRHVVEVRAILRRLGI